MSNLTTTYNPISTGITILDETLGGRLCPFGMTVLGEYTGTGKTSLALQITSHVIASGRPVLYVSLDMTSVQLATKLIVHDNFDPQATGPSITALDLLTGHISDAIRPQIASYFRNTAPQLFVLERHPEMRVAEIGELGAQINTATGMPPLIVIDCFQLLPVDDPHMQDRHAINANIDTLKSASAKYPMLVLSAFNRASYQAADGSAGDKINHDAIMSTMESVYKETANLADIADILLGLCTVQRSNDMTDIDLYVIKHQWSARSTEPVALTLHGPSGTVLQRSAPKEDESILYF